MDSKPANEHFHNIPSMRKAAGQRAYHRTYIYEVSTLHFEVADRGQWQAGLPS